MKRIRITLLLGALAASVASAQITPVATPFVGDESEDFTGLSGATSIRVFNNSADLASQSGTMIVTGGWGSSGCTIGNLSSPSLAGSSGGYAEYTFDTPVGQFGGYLGTNTVTDPSTLTAVAEFYDDGGSLIGTEPLNLGSTCGSWNWNGWSSATPIKQVRLINSTFGGSRVHMDDMEYILAPVVAAPSASTTSLFVTILLVAAAMSVFMVRK